MPGFVKILLVDDNADVRELLAFMLNESGFLVITADNGLGGLKVAEAERPDLVITDICMPHLDGIQMIIRLRKLLEFGTLPILVISAYGSGETAAALSAGANLAIHKPVDFDCLIDHVKQLLPQRQLDNRPTLT
jgi:two-component system, OmpR family, alkaline phosphatase synthesis response regulator PhoP